MSSKLERRIAALEAQSGLHNPIYAVHLVDVGQVEFLDTRERLTLAAFQEQYSSGQIVLVMKASMWEAV